MSTKNLARTVVEGGRAHGNCWDRRWSNQVARARAREALSGATHAADMDDVVIPSRTPVRRQFHDKLSAARRWLVSQVGRPWGKVYGELRARFDTRTTAGRHIVFDHMLPWVETEPHRWFRPEFKVERHGILRALPRWQYPSWHVHEPLPRPESELGVWLDNRRVGARGDVLFWFVQTPASRFRQHRRLVDDEAALWRSLPAGFREKYDAWAPPCAGKGRI